MNKRLSDYFDSFEVSCDGTFIELGHADSTMTGTLAYCDTVHYLGIAATNPCVSCVLTTPALAEQAVAGKGWGGVLSLPQRRVGGGFSLPLKGAEPVLDRPEASVDLFVAPLEPRQARIDRFSGHVYPPRSMVPCWIP